MGAITVLALMAGAGVVHVDMGGDLKANGQDAVFFLMEAVLFFNQQTIELAGGDVDAKFAQLFEQQRLSDVAVEILVKDEADHRRTEMLAV